MTRAPAIIFIVLVLSITLQGCATAPEDPYAGDFQVSFKLDPRLSGATYGGERWVPPPYGPIAYSGTYTVEARTDYIDVSGKQVEIVTEWIPEDPQIVTVSPGKGKRVTITVQGLGETSLLVKTSRGNSKTLYIKATAQNDLVQVVEISE